MLSPGAMRKRCLQKWSSSNEVLAESADLSGGSKYCIATRPTMERLIVTEGWDESAAAWIAELDEHGDYTRTHVLDPVMKVRTAGRGFAFALDVGCGEGRFCRLMRLAFPAGDYRRARAEQLPFLDAQFDLVVSYLSLIDIADAEQAIAEMVRVLQPGGTLLIANLTSFSSAAAPG